MEKLKAKVGSIAKALSKGEPDMLKTLVLEFPYVPLPLIPLYTNHLTNHHAPQQTLNLLPHPQPRNLPPPRHRHRSRTPPARDRTATHVTGDVSKI